MSFTSNAKQESWLVSRSQNPNYSQTFATQQQFKSPIQYPSKGRFLENADGFRNMSSQKQDLFYSRQSEQNQRSDHNQNNRECIASQEQETFSEQEQSYVPSDMLSNIFDSHKSLKEVAAETSLGMYFSYYPTSDHFNENEASKILRNDHCMVHDKRDISKENSRRKHEDHSNYISSKDSNNLKSAATQMQKQQYLHCEALDAQRISGEYQINQTILSQSANNPTWHDIELKRNQQQQLQQVSSKSQTIPDTILEDIASDILKNQAYLQNTGEMAQMDVSSKDRLYLYESILEEGSQSSQENEKIRQIGEQSCYSHFKDGESSLDRLSAADIGGSKSKRAMSQLGEGNDGNSRSVIKESSRQDRKWLNQGNSLEKEQIKRINRAQREEDEAKILDKELKELEDELKRVGEEINKADSHVNKLEIKRRKLRQKHQQLGFTPEVLRNQATALHALRDREEKNNFIINELNRCNKELAQQLLEMQNEHQPSTEQQKTFWMIKRQ